MAKKAAENAKSETNGNGSDSGLPMPLFYKKPEPLDSRKHSKMGLKKNFGLGFTINVNAVPINMIEMPQICRFYPIAFSPDGNATPVALVGVRDNENLFVNAKGEWTADCYIPAYIRRYPFIFSEMPGNEQLALCVDMNDAIVNDNGEQKFFETDGKPTQLAKNAMEFCKSYHAAAQQTQEFSKALAASGLLVDRQAEINVGEGKKIAFSGFRIVDEQKLAEMSDKDFMEWRKKGWLPFLYAHLFSGAQWQNLTRLLRMKMEKEAAH
jgi:hypothetical protein